MNHVLFRRPAVGADRYAMQHGSTCPAALDAFADATEGLAAYRRDIMPAVERALAADEGCVAASALKGLLLVLAGRAEALLAAREVWRTMPAEAATSDEIALCVALREGLRTGPLAAAAALEAHLARRPDLLLFVKLSTMLRFVGGDVAGMRRTTELVLPSWRRDRPGYGYVLGCHAFALEEAGEYAAAERTGRTAVGIAPHDAWAVHAVAHVHEMTGRPADGMAWIEALRLAWRGCNSFAFHLSWHLALFHLERGDHARALDLYDTEVRPDRSEDMRDYGNAVSLLWRLRQHGVAVGDRWDELAGIARRRRHETTLLFGTLHRLLALLAVDDLAAADELVAAIDAAAAGTGEQATVAATFGAGLARALRATAGTAPLTGLAGRLAPLGGSHAQRDVFVRTLAMLAERSGDTAALAEILAVRRRMKRDDRFLEVLAT